jgi:hypothetical protein
MDPLSVAANVVAVVEGLSMTIKLLRKIIALKNAPNEVLELMNEVQRKNPWSNADNPSSARFRQC